MKKLILLLLFVSFSAQGQDFYFSGNGDQITIGTVINTAAGDRRPASEVFTTEDYQVIGQEMLDQVSDNNITVLETHYPGYPDTRMYRQGLDGYYRASRRNAGWSPFGSYVVTNGNSYYKLFREIDNGGDTYTVALGYTTIQIILNSVLTDAFSRGY